MYDIVDRDLRHRRSWPTTSYVVTYDVARHIGIIRRRRSDLRCRRLARIQMYHYSHYFKLEQHCCHLGVTCCALIVSALLSACPCTAGLCVHTMLWCEQVCTCLYQHLESWPSYWFISVCNGKYLVWTGTYHATSRSKSWLKMMLNAKWKVHIWYWLKESSSRLYNGTLKRVPFQCSNFRRPKIN